MESLAVDETTAAWGQWIANARQWHIFGGLTFDPKRVQGWDRWTKTMQPRRITRDLAVSRLAQWLNDSHGMIGPFEYVIAMEWQKNGNAHFHPLIHIPQGLKDGTIAALGRKWWELAGLNLLEEPRDIKAVAEYASKYLVKDLASGDILMSPGAREAGTLPEHGYVPESLTIRTAKGAQQVIRWVRKEGN